MDIFISYTESDRPWAFWIGQELKKLGHTPHVHEWEISGGGDIPKWMEERLQTADRVLCVISQKYLTKGYSGWERMSAAWAAVGDRTNFMLPLLVEECEVPILLAPFKRCDLFKAGGNEEEARTRLATFLEEARPPTQPMGYPGAAKLTPATSAAQQEVSFPTGRAELGNIKTGIKSLTNKLDSNPGIHDRVLKDREKLDRLKDRIDLMSNLKVLHDFLHDLQIKVYPQIIDTVHVLETSPGAQFGLAQILEQLREDCEKARAVASGLPEDDPDRDAPWIKDLEVALPKLQSAATLRDTDAALAAISSFRFVIQRKQLTLDERLHTLAQNLPLKVLRKLLEDVCGLVPKGDDFERWNRAQESLKSQEVDLNAMVEEHHAWQDLESKFQFAGSILEIKSVVIDWNTFNFLWSDLKGSVKDIAGIYPGADWVKQSSDIAIMVDTGVSQSNTGQVREFFKYFRNNSLQHFSKLDKRLKDKCKEISAIREPLQDLLDSAKQ